MDSTSTIIRTADEIERAHDVLLAVLRLISVEGFDAPEGLKQHLADSAAVLCWLLGHDYNPTFADNLKWLEDVLAASGIAVIDSHKAAFLMDPRGRLSDERLKKRVSEICRENKSRFIN
jgi:hypothetical protein